MAKHRDDPMRLWVGTWQPEPLGRRPGEQAGDRGAASQGGGPAAPAGSPGETTSVRSLL